MRCRIGTSLQTPIHVLKNGASKRILCGVKRLQQPGTDHAEISAGRSPVGEAQRSENRLCFLKDCKI